MRLALLLLLVLVVGWALRWLVRYSLGRDSSNAAGGQILAHDSTVAAYARRSKELAELRETELPAPGSPSVAKAPEVEVKFPETRVGGSA